jgi:ArsR family transcriptional regulator, arsenate/arsenite/antimonite-responsive transcriptional repressor
MKEYVKKIKAVSDPIRIRIMKVLVEAGSEMCVCEIVDSLKVPFYTISKHIKELKNADLINETRDGKFIMYGITRDKDSFSPAIISLLSEIPDSPKDMKSLKKRLSIRVNSKCVIGIKVRKSSGK